MRHGAIIRTIYSWPLGGTQSFSILTSSRSASLYSSSGRADAHARAELFIRRCSQGRNRRILTSASIGFQPFEISWRNEHLAEGSS